MRKFSIPYNNDIFLLDKLISQLPDYINQCKEIYFAAPNKLAGTGRVLNQCDSYEDDIDGVLKKAHDNGIESNLLINSGCLGFKLLDSEFINDITSYIYHLGESAGLDIITVSDYYLAREIKRTFREIELECSSIAYVDSIEKAKYWEDIGCDIIVIPPVLNKNLRFISEIREHLSNVQLKLVVNQVCLHGCPMWCSHHNLRGHGNEGDIYSGICKNLFDEKPWLLYSSSFIPPEYMSYYDECIDIYKLVDRRYTTADILQSLGAYCEDRNYNEKIFELNGLIPEEVFKKVVYCNKNCSSCGFCEAKYLETFGQGNN